MEKSTQEIMEEIKKLNTNINDVTGPMLRDGNKDLIKIITKQFIIISFLIIGLVVTVIYSQYLMNKQSNEFINKYNDFLSQFEFESEETYQLIDGGDGSNSTINDGIEIVK